MRKAASGLVNVRAISGTHVVFLAFDMREQDARRLMGFAIQRTDLIEDETIWLRGNKTFASIRPPTGFEDASSRQHPFQVFQWADYTAKPGYRYKYRVIPTFGRPGSLEEQQATDVTIETEPLSAGKHDLHFNRGAIASQAFVQRFPGQTLDEAGAPAYTWLARDLVPALIEFIALAKDESYSLHAALYELSLPDGQPWTDVLSAIKGASASGAEVKLIYHAGSDVTGTKNGKVLKKVKFKSGIAIARKKAKLMHNKFIVLSRNGKPVAVWTGSTNISRNALYGQLNFGHVVRDKAVAARYLAYWQKLHEDPDPEELKDWTEAENALPPIDDGDEILPIFSPHRGEGVFKWWIELASAGRPLFMTFPFGIVKDFRPAFDVSDGVLRFALLDKYVNGGNKASRAAAIEDIERIRRHPNIGMALGNHIHVDWIDGWRKESDPIGVNVNWIHTKFMLIDPLGDKPVTLAGSANFSAASVNENDENMLLIRGDTRVADIFFGEFMRVFAHHRFRESVKRHLAEVGSAARNTWKPQDLFESPREWVPTHFKKGSEKDIKRRYFIGG
ncbi:phospholipase D-like domain-containing protein [Variovorax sp. J22P271]|uniref:phospholipase D-like domain-containing protein n=1 Tax=Variovorax davisae TaxID=3053515 RepID=UPI00257656C1|nr:phospholipase D-like domain-containing protein [Variovorax sp. J22P271]MDM0034880.1 phospholipase D-like domain-containing protein [Variovorax sp. J22P271]